MTRTGILLPLLTLAFVCLFAVGQGASLPSYRRFSGNTCGYESCTKSDPKKLNVHLIPHTHDDVGWLKTVDQYFFGSKTNIQRAGVQYILDTVIQSLLANPERKFIYVETAFLWKWWLRQNDQVKEQVRGLINEGRLEIIGGGWSMNDEAVTHYHSLIDQYTWGFRRLNDTFGSCARPHIGWQIDPFGHSREQASMFAQMGFDGVFVGRIDYQDRNKRKADKTMEYLWKGSPNLGSRADLFTVTLYSHYSPPPGFCFDVLCSDDPIIDDPSSPDYNVKDRVNEFVKYVTEQATAFRTNNVLITMGGDFTYQDAEMYYANMDRLIRYRQGLYLTINSQTDFFDPTLLKLKAMAIRKIQGFVSYVRDQAKSYKTNNIFLTMGDDFHFQNADMWFNNLDKLIRYVTEFEGSSIKIFYSTPSCYLKSLHDLNLEWSTKTDDLFPYANDPHAYWTGYYSSRPTIKFYERLGNNLLQISKQLSALTDLENYDEQLEFFREAMGVMQHHDAITGTEKQAVAFDYARLLYDNVHYGEEITVAALSKWSTKGSKETIPKMHSCSQLNISSCAYTEDNKSFVLSLYNPIGQPASTFVRVPVQGPAYTVTDLAENKEILSQLVPIPEDVKKIPGRVSKATHELVFRATIPPLGYKAYAVVEKEAERNIEAEVATSISNELFDVSVINDGRISVEWIKQQNMNLVQSFHYYEGMDGDNRAAERRASGAYIFRPRDVSTKNFASTTVHKIYKGPVVEEIHQTINEWVSQVIRVYKGEEHIEFDWLVGPIPVEDSIGKEIVTQYSSNLQSKHEFYTDSNGREMLKRTKDYRPTWNLDLKEPVAGNYYPITSKISLKDEEKSLKLSVLVDRAQGGTSMKDGELELMLHRRLLKDDAFGVGEALNESAFGQGLVVRGTHYVFGGSTKDVDAFAHKEKQLTLQMSLRPWTLVAPVTGNALDEWRNAHNVQTSGLAKPLPANINILTLEPWKDGTVLLRLEHLYELGEAIQLSQPVEINIQDLFSTFTILSVQETTLGGNQWLKDMNRLKWQESSNNILEESAENIRPAEMQENVINVLLKPMEIRTFIVRVSPRKL